MHAIPRTLTVCGCFSVALLVANPVDAAAPPDPYGPRGSWTNIIQSKTSQVALGLTLQQVKTAASLKSNTKDNRDTIAKFLRPDQLVAMKRISWKQQGGYALFDSELSKQLEITVEQKGRLKEASEVNAIEHKKMKDFLARARFGSREAMQKYIKGYRDAADKRLLDVLTAKQKKKLASILV